MTSVGENIAPVPGRPIIAEHQLEYDTINYKHSQKKTSYAFFLSGTTNVGNTAANLQVGTPTQTDVHITPGVYNLAKSYMEYQLKLPAQPNVGGQNSSIAVPRDTCDFDTVQLIDVQSNGYLADVRFAQKYTQSVGKAETAIDGWLTNNDDYAPCVVSDQPAGIVPTSANGAAPIVGGQAQVRIDTNANAPTFVNYSEPYALDISAPAAAANGTAMTLTRRVPLSLFKRSLLAVDKVIAFPQKICLRLIWSSIANLGWAFNGTTAVNIVNGAVPLNTTYTLTAGDSNVQNFRVVLYNEADSDISVALMKQAMSGIKISVPYVWGNRIVQQTQGLHTVSLDISPQHGFNLQRVYTVPFWGSGTTAISTKNSIGFYDHSQLNAAGTAGANFLTTVQTFMNQQPLQSVALDPSWPKRETWNWVRPYIKGSILSLAPKLYDANYLHVDGFDGTSIDTKIEGKYDQSDLLSGMPIVASNTYEFRGNTGAGVTAAAGLDYYVFVCTQRYLVLKDGQIAIMSQ